MANRIQLRRDTEANWFRVNPILEDGEPGYVTDTDQIKYGDGNTAWRDLAYSGYMKSASMTKSMGMETTSGKTGVWLADESISIFEGQDGLWFSQYGDIIADYDDDWGGGVAYDSDGNIFVMAGSHAEGYNTSPTMLLLKYSTQGEILWQHEFSEGYSNGPDYQYIGDNIYIGRDDQIFGTWQNQHSPAEGYVGSFDSNGYMDQRVIYWNGPRSDMQAMDGWIDPAVDASLEDDHIYVVGFTEGYPSLGWIHKLQATNLNNRIWQKGIDTSAFSEGSTYFHDVAAHADGAYVCGEGYDNINDSVSYNGYQGLISSWNANGDLSWHRIYKQLENGGSWTGFFDIKIDRNGDIITSGAAWGDNSDYPAMATIAKISATDGEVIWTKRATSPNDLNSYGSSIAIGADNQIYWMGTTAQRPDQNNYQGLFFMELDTDGNIRWQNTLGGDNQDLDVWNYSGHRELALSPDGKMLATTGYGYITPGDDSSEYKHIITAQLPADGSRAKSYVSRNNLIYAPCNMQLVSVNMTSRDLDDTYSVDTDWWSNHSGFYVDDFNSFQSEGYRNHELTRFGGSWTFTDGDITLPYEGDILRNDGSSAIRDLKVKDIHNLGGDYYIQSSDAGGLIYAEGYYTVYIPKRQNGLDMPVGTVVTIVNSGDGADLLYIRMQDDATNENYLYGAGTNTNHSNWSLPQNSIATIVKVWNNPDNNYQCKWIISGVGLAQV